MERINNLTRKNDIIKHLLKNAAEKNDWNMLQIVLRQCWNKTSLFRDQYSDDGDSLLHITCRYNFIQSARVLIEHGLNADYRNNDGDTCLHIAAETGNILILRLLFEAGANPISKNNSGKQPVDISENEEIKELLRRYILKNAELQLMRKFNALKEIVAEEEKKEELFLRTCKSWHYYDDLERPKLPSFNDLVRIDSGIYSDIGSSLHFVNANEDISSINQQLPSLILSPPSNSTKNENNHAPEDGSRVWNQASVSMQRLKPPADIEEESTQSKFTKKALSKTKSCDTSKRFNKSTEKTPRKKKLSLPSFQVEGSKETYV